MNKKNDSLGIKLRNINVGKATASVVLTPQSDKDHVLLNRLLNEDVVVEPVTLTDELEEIDGHEDRLKRGHVRGVRLAVRPKPKAKVAKKPTAAKSDD